MSPRTARSVEQKRRTTRPPMRRRTGGWRRPRIVPAMEFDIACGRMLTHEDKVANLRRIGQFKARTIEAIGRDRLHWVDTACGGCLLFLGREWQAPLVEQVRSLLRWASDLAIPVRVALHYGGVQLVEDEAGLVGQTGDLLESIGWFLTLGADAAVLASGESRSALRDQPGGET